MSQVRDAELRALTGARVEAQDETRIICQYGARTMTLGL